MAIPNVFVHGKWYEHVFEKKCNGHKHCGKSRSKSTFDRFYVNHLEKILVIPNVLAHSRKFKILAIPNVLAHGKSYEHGFKKKCDGHKLCAKSSSKSTFDRFFMHHLRNSKYYPFPTY
ncbi:hypothetical protein BHE74_00056706 [Ensete ventricosum]|nr:hypothetical protein BHE74_00056706 [Ensete ventricosum]